ncbi:MAG: tRNA pseudouridine(38-40) synthase TruA [Phycisphaerae bacterium]
MDRPTRNIKLIVAYNGAAYHGWQRQADGIDTVQLRVEQAASAVCKHPVTVHGSGRTDAGVHAAGQVANFHTPNLTVPLSGLRRAMNSRLPADIAIRSAAVVPDDFHASISAIGKTYRYRICVGPTRPVDRARLVYHYWRPLELEPMIDAAARLVGTHDFRSLASSQEQRENTVRTITACDVSQIGDEIHVQVSGTGFLYHMVRNITGTLIEVGRGRWSPEHIGPMLASLDRKHAGPTAPPDGLSLIRVHYRPEDIAPPA